MNERYRLKNIAIVLKNSNTGPIEYWSGTDSKEQFIKSLSTMPADWKYRTKPVLYKNNSLGYRSKELEEVDTSNFFMAYGCSFTSGVGLAEDEMWTTIVSNDLNMDHLNFGMGGAGMDFIHLNTVSFLSNTDVRPNFVILQCPEFSRSLHRSLDKFAFAGPNFPGSDEIASMYEKSIKDGSYLFNSYVAFKSTLALWKAANVPVYVWTMNRGWADLVPDFDFDFYSINNMEQEPSNRARDLLHFPSTYMERVGHSLAEKIRNNPDFYFRGK